MDAVAGSSDDGVGHPPGVVPRGARGRAAALRSAVPRVQDQAQRHGREGGEGHEHGVAERARGRAGGGDAAHLVRELAAQRGVRAQAEEGGPARARPRACAWRGARGGGAPPRRDAATPSRGEGRGRRRTRGESAEEEEGRGEARRTGGLRRRRGFFSRKSARPGFAARPPRARSACKQRRRRRYW